jgi:hypothetical protein
MTTEKKWTKIFGQPQGNELVWANNILRKTGQFNFKTIRRCENNTQANYIFYSWLKENNGENYDSSRIA